jgi:cytochrome c peroxidase
VGHAPSTSADLRMSKALCSLPNDNPLTRIGSEVPGPNDTPWIVPLATADRVRVQDTFDLMGRAIAAFEASPEVSPFSSKFDAFLAGKAKLSPAEMRGYALFGGQARYANEAGSVRLRRRSRGPGVR